MADWATISSLATAGGTLVARAYAYEKQIDAYQRRIVEPFAPAAWRGHSVRIARV